MTENILPETAGTEMDNTAETAGTAADNTTETAGTAADNTAETAGTAADNSTESAAGGTPIESIEAAVVDTTAGGTPDPILSGTAAEPCVSIVVPVYKVPEQFLRKCIESCLAQTLSGIEILLVDDGSPDDCGSICDEYAERDSRIHVIHKANGGLCSARNAGCLAAAGEWIMFVDGDDWIDADMCETMYEAGMREDVELVMCGITKEYEHSSQVYRFYLRDYLEDGKVYRGRECKWLQKQLLVYNGNIAVAYSKLIRRKLLTDNHILHDEELRQGAEGLEFNLRLFEKLRSAVFVNRPFYHYIYNDTSISASHSEENHAFVIKCFERIRELIEKSENRDKLLPWFDNRLLYVIITTAISGYFNPDNPASFSEKKRGYAKYLEQPIVAKALQTTNLRGLSKQRRVVLFLIRHRQFRALDAMGRARKWQKEHL